MNPASSLEEWVAQSAPTTPCLQTWGRVLSRRGFSWDTFRHQPSEEIVAALQHEGIPRVIARDIVSSVQQACKDRQRPLCILWDLEDSTTVARGDPHHSSGARPWFDVAQQIREEQDAIANKQNARIDKHQAALMREQASQAPLSGLLNLGAATVSKASRRPLRLARLT